MAHDRYIRFTGRLCIVTGSALLVLAGAEAARAQPFSAVVWFVAGSFLIVWGRWRLKSAGRQRS